MAPTASFDGAVRALRQAESVTRCIEIFAGFLESFVVEPPDLAYVGLLTFDDRMQPCLACRDGDDYWMEKVKPAIEPLCKDLVISKKNSSFNWGEAVPQVRQRDFTSEAATFHFFLIGCHGIVILGALSPLRPQPLRRPLLELATSLRQLELSKRATDGVQDKATLLLKKDAYRERTELSFIVAHQCRSPVSIAILDLDNFKKLNTFLGYLNADLVVESLGRLIVETVGDDLARTVEVGRFGGDEFMFTFMGDGEFAKSIIEPIHQGVPSLEPEVTEGTRAELRKIGGCSASVGIATCRFDGGADDWNVDTLIKCANVALTNAKKSKNCVVLYDSLIESEKKVVTAP
ncbi:hypothetical protein MTO96_015144 [Rhipicephalus appendiculatus]|uniref:Diguanylate-cyclase n=1 Tax=Rhipicephalus appendiculatus TaxID=34631 RepID=A0A131YIY1_RHIAP